MQEDDTREGYIANLWLLIDCANPELRLSCIYGRNRRRQDLPPDSSYRQSWVHARHESQLDHVADGFGIRSKILTRTNMGSVLQHHRFRHWDMDQLAD